MNSTPQQNTCELSDTLNCNTALEQKQAVRLLRRKINLVLRVGKLLMESAADTNRIERNMKRVAAFLGIPEDVLHIDVRWTMLIVNVSDETHSFSKMQRCEHHGVNMSTITAVSDLSWRAIDKDFSIEEFERELDGIAAKPRNYKPYLVAVMAGFACGGFCKLFGGDWMAFLFASVSAFLGFRVRARCIEGGLNVYFSMALAALSATLCAYLSTYSGLSHTPFHSLLACALFLVPGVPLINFVDDMIDNFLLVGITRAANSMMTIGAMTVGIILALGLVGFDDTSIASKFGGLSIIPHESYLSYAIAAAISAVGFSMIFNIPRRLLWVVAVGGIITVCTRNFLNLELGAGPIIGSFVGALLVSLIALKAVHLFHVPGHVLTIPSVIPMIPGVLMYRSLLGFVDISTSQGDVTVAFSNGVSAVLIVLAISLGVAIPNIIARRYTASAHKRQLDTMLDERRKRREFFRF
ncbi:MAG: threonine/serine exporter family protein [Rikenellaceae bacterium]